MQNLSLGYLDVCAFVVSNSNWLSCQVPLSKSSWCEHWLTIKPLFASNNCFIVSNIKRCFRKTYLMEYCRQFEVTFVRFNDILKRRIGKRKTENWQQRQINKLSCVHFLVTLQRSQMRKKGSKTKCLFLFKLYSFHRKRTYLFRKTAQRTRQPKNMNLKLKRR